MSHPILTLLQPKFLSKEERAQLAIAKRAQEIREQREKEESTRKNREALERDAQELAAKESSGNRYGTSRCRYFLFSSAIPAPPISSYRRQ
jgi:hypothetical protein